MKMLNFSVKGVVHQWRQFPGVLPCFVQGVYSILPPSSVFVLIMSAEATQAATEGRKDVRDRAAVLSEQPPGVRRSP